MCAWCWADGYCCSLQQRAAAAACVGRHRRRRGNGRRQAQRQARWWDTNNNLWPNFGARDSQLGTTLCHSSFQTVHAMNALSSSRAHPARPAFGRAAQANSGRMANSVRVNAFGNRDGQGFSSEALSVLQRRIAQQQQQRCLGLVALA